MTRRPGPPSKRDKVRDTAARVLRDAGTELHVSDIAALVLPTLGPADAMTVKDLNTALHDDPLRRFERVAMGTWKLSPRPLSPR